MVPGNVLETANILFDQLMFEVGSYNEAQAVWNIVNILLTAESLEPTRPVPHPGKLESND